MCFSSSNLVSPLTSKTKKKKEPDLQSFLPSNELGDVSFNANVVTDMPVLYCGPRGPLLSVTSAVNANNTRVFVDGEAGHKYHLRLLEEVF